jgi:hypothetical protein
MIVPRELSRVEPAALWVTNDKYLPKPGDIAAAGIELS